jgi:hypothetical protein
MPIFLNMNLDIILNKEIIIFLNSVSYFTCCYDPSRICPEHISLYLYIYLSSAHYSVLERSIGGYSLLLPNGTEKYTIISFMLSFLFISAHYPK